MTTLQALNACSVDEFVAAVALIAAHPDLAGRVAREGRLTPASRGEQAVAGLDRLTSAETARFDAANARYRERFGFPFVICVREHDKASILAALESRGAHDRAAEIATALAEIAKIARLRLEDAVR
jgi:2-oxo-4-hydroxy-4-carboxy-5-ureidoimidazoline decarboxylase